MLTRSRDENGQELTTNGIEMKTIGVGSKQFVAGFLRISNHFFQLSMGRE